MPRSFHAAWDPPASRADPIGILQAQGKQRIAVLLPLRYERMRASAFAYMRGSATVMASDLGSIPHTGLLVQLCGDAHLMNFGSYASPEGNPVFDCNDFDETLPGPFEWDLKRLAASLVVSGRQDGLADGECRALAVRCVKHYRRHMERLAGLPPLEAWHATIDLRRAIDQIDQHKLRRRLEKRLRAVLESGEAHYHLVDEDQMTISDGGNVRHMTEFASTIDRAFAAYPASLQPQFRDLVGRYSLRDRAMKVVGIGSVGTLCAIGLFASADGAPLLLQVKEAQASVLAPFTGGPEPASQGERVVTGQRRMQAQSDIFLGWTETAVDDRQFYVRRLKDSRLADIGAMLEAEMLPFAAELTGRTLARAHGRAGDAALLSGYMSGRDGDDGDGFDQAIAAFAVAYADQTERDYEQFCGALESGVLGAA